MAIPLHSIICVTLAFTTEKCNIKENGNSLSVTAIHTHPLTGRLSFVFSTYVIWLSV